MMWNIEMKNIIPEHWKLVFSVLEEFKSVFDSKGYDERRTLGIGV